MDADQIDKMTQLVRAIGDLRNLAVIGIISVALLAFAAFVYYQRSKSKQVAADRAAEAKTQAAKTKRAADYAAALHGLSAAHTVASAEIKAALNSFETVLRSHQASATATDQVTIDVLVRLTGSIGSSQRTMEELARKLQPRLTPKDSIRYIQRVFVAEITQAMSKLIQDTVIKNGYEGDSDFISKELRAMMGDKLRWHQTDLESYQPLTVRVADFFVLDRSNPSVERFTLCDILWGVAEPLLAEGANDSPEDHQRKLLVRAERVPLLVQNAIRDYFSSVVTDYQLDDERDDRHDTPAIARRLNVPT